MNIKRFKKFIFIYLISFALLCIFVPTNTYFDGSVQSRDFSSQSKEKINYGLQYKFVGNIGYEDIHDLVYVPEYSSKRSAEGFMITNLNKSILVIELTLLTVIFLGVSYIVCKKNN